MLVNCHSLITGFRQPTKAARHFFLRLHTRTVHFIEKPNWLSEMCKFILVICNELFCKIRVLVIQTAIFESMTFKNVMRESSSEAVQP